MSFYQTNNQPIRRFHVNDPSKKVVSPFQSMARICQIENIGSGTGAYYTGSNPLNTNYFLTSSQLLNGAVIVSPTGLNGAAGVYTLPSAFNLQEFLGGRAAFNTVNNQLANCNTGLNDYFLLNVYNTNVSSGTFVAYDNLSSKNIAPAVVYNDVVSTPVLIQFTGTGLASFGTSTAANSYASYTVL